MQHLAAQLHDHEAKIQGLHEQIFNLHQEVDCECCHADKAETELRSVVDWKVTYQEGEASANHQEGP